MDFDFLQPLDKNFFEFIQSLSMQTLGKKTVFHTQTDFPNLDKASIAIIGVLENRGGASNSPVDVSFIRKEFYQLFPGNWQSQIVDLGNILPGNTLEDTYYVLKTIVSKLLKKNILPIILGGSQDLTYPMYRAYDQLEQMVNLVSIDSRFDFEKENSCFSDSFLTKIVIEEPNNLFNFSNIGYQTYQNAQEEIDLIEKLFFDAYRLGEIIKDTSLAEPVFRDADLVSLDFNAIKSSDSGNFIKFVPNGFDGREICTLSRYAGISDKVSAFGIFNHNSSKEESVLIAQIIWYFIEGIQFRSKEYPFGSKDNYVKYIVALEEELVFYKSDKTERWWIEIPFFSNKYNKYKNTTLFPCSHVDYLAACNGEIPERWWKTQRKRI
jgi:arginase family enzyme